MREIPLVGKNAHGRVALVDDADYELVSRYRWWVSERPPSPGHRGHGPYAVTNLTRAGRTITTGMHKLITGWPQTDHRNHDGLDNQRHNLREATDAQNHHNSLPRTGSSSAYKGVSWYRQRGKWQVLIETGGKQRHIGYFTDEVEAARAYDDAARELFGDRAWLNFPAPGADGEVA